MGEVCLNDLVFGLGIKKGRKPSCQEALKANVSHVCYRYNFSSKCKSSL